MPPSFQKRDQQEGCRRYCSRGDDNNKPGGPGHDDETFLVFVARPVHSMVGPKRIVSVVLNEKYLNSRNKQHDLHR